MSTMRSLGIETQVSSLRTRDEDAYELSQVRPNIARFVIHVQWFPRRLSERQRKPGRNAGRGSWEAQAGKNGRVGERSERFDQQDTNARALREGIVTCKIRRLCVQRWNPPV